MIGPFDFGQVAYVAKFRLLEDRKQIFFVCHGEQDDVMNSLVLEKMAMPWTEHYFICNSDFVHSLGQRSFASDYCLLRKRKWLSNAHKSPYVQLRHEQNRIHNSYIKVNFVTEDIGPGNRVNIGSDYRWARPVPTFKERPSICSAAAASDFESADPNDVLSSKRSNRSENGLLAEVRKKRRELATLINKAKSVADEDNKWFFWKKRTANSRATTRRVIELANRKQLNQILEILNDAKEESKKLNIKTMNAVLAACVRCNDIDLAKNIFNGMLQPGNCGVDDVSYGILIKGLGVARQLDEAFELIDAMEAGKAPGNPKLSMVHLNTLINACADIGDAKRARGVLIRYRSVKGGAAPSAITYNMLVKGYARSDNPLEALLIRDEMISQGLKPEKYTYNSLILACVRGGDMSKALELLMEMKEEARKQRSSELYPDVVTYTTILKGFADTGDLDALLKLVVEMKQAPNFVLDRVAYTSIIDACIAAASPLEGLRFLNEMKEEASYDRQLKPRAHAFLALMRSFAEMGDVDRVFDLRQRMVPESAGHVWPEDRAEADELLVEAAVNSGQYDFARRILEGMVGLRKRLPLNRRAYSAIIRLQAVFGFQDPLFQPYMLKDKAYLYMSVERICIPFEEAKPVDEDLQLTDVVMRFYKDDVLPVVNKNGRCIGAVYSKDCHQLDVRLGDIARGPLPTISSSTAAIAALPRLLEEKTVLFMVVKYGDNMPVGFLTREIMLQFCCM